MPILTWEGCHFLLPLPEALSVQKPNDPCEGNLDPAKALPRLLKNQIMNIHRTLLRLLGALTLTGASIAAGASVTVPVNGDIFLGVRASGGQGSGVSLLINVKDDTTLRNATGGSNLALATVNTELTAAFGPNWSTRSDLTWASLQALEG